MNAALVKTLKTVEVCSELIERLKHKAVQRNDPISSLALRDVAVVATRAVHALWVESTISKPLDPKKRDRYLNARREMLSFFLGGSPLPILDGDTTHSAMIQGIKYGAFKRRNRKRTTAKAEIDEWLIPTFQAIQFSPNRPDGIEGEIWDLPALTTKSAKDWSSVAVEWLLTKHPERLTPGAPLFRSANPDIYLEKDRATRQNALEREKRAWIRADEKDADRRYRYRGRMNAQQQAIAQKKQKEIDGMRTTKAHLRQGLKAFLIKYFKRNLVA